VRAQNDEFAGMLYYHPEDFSVAERAQEVAKAHNATGSQIALAWILSKPYITAPIIGASKLEHLDQSIAALEIKLAPEQIKHLEELYQPHPVLGHS
jgi:aryl-alcohol dehydrogenase (NADP+)